MFPLRSIAPFIGNGSEKLSNFPVATTEAMNEVFSMLFMAELDASSDNGNSHEYMQIMCPKGRITDSVVARVDYDDRLEGS